VSVIEVIFTGAAARKPAVTPHYEEVVVQEGDYSNQQS
jgi:hypothetical protein